MKTKITSGFWHDRLEVNAQRAIFHQWEQLEASGCIENFRIAAGDVDGFREGWFFADSDAYKWLDAASRIYASFPTPELASVMDAFIPLVARAQHPDGYIFTYNQIHFPKDRWKNLQIEHELYCHGHLIEAGVSHYEATARTDMLAIARRAADRIVEDFLGKGTDHTPGHEEIEIALLRLYQVTDHQPYLEMARQFIEQRGRNPLFALSLIRQNSSVDQRRNFIKQKKQEYLSAHPEFKPFQLPPDNASKQPRYSRLRWQINALSGKYFQQHAPVRKQTVPVGHSVRFAYFETAVAMLARENGDRTLVHALEQVWERMVTRRMYVTGGIGSVPGSEGFGNDYELDPEYAYAETCAALASMFWNWEMAQLTNEAKYSDLFEWQLYNAAAVGMGLDGTSYLYNNPLTCRGGVTRKPWYSVPCCPSNLSRTWADLGKYIFSSNEYEIFIHQYISSEYDGGLAKIDIRSELPWTGKVKITVDPSVPSEFTLNLRLPSWCNTESTRVTCNGEFFPVSPAPQQNEITASGYDPREGRWLNLKRIWNSGDVVELNFDMPIQLRHAHPKVKGHHSKVAITRGPLVYCLESVDNPNVDIFNVAMDKTSLESVFDRTSLGGITKIIGQTKTGEPLTFIPYHLWGNRGESTMTVWVNE
ncbi:MAG: glycoside hydrolase family 127 protein [Anaerolineales bacterium]|nr:glycoside hydrolase family 127 protein [Anaerolineales bacterium]